VTDVDDKQQQCTQDHCLLASQRALYYISNVIR